MCLHKHFCEAVNAAAARSTERRQPRRDARQPFLRLLYLKSKQDFMNLPESRQIRKMRQTSCTDPKMLSAFIIPHIPKKRKRKHLFSEKSLYIMQTIPSAKKPVRTLARTALRRRLRDGSSLRQPFARHRKSARFCEINLIAVGFALKIRKKLRAQSP